jgi:hypothetical protein
VFHIVSLKNTLLNFLFLPASFLPAPAATQACARYLSGTAKPDGV